jgi:hypothetical protein
MPEELTDECQACPNCGQTMTQTMTIRRIFAEYTDVFQCRMCRVSITSVLHLSPQADVNLNKN